MAQAGIALTGFSLALVYPVFRVEAVRAGRAAAWRWACTASLDLAPRSAEPCAARYSSHRR
jgi:hypothetical protein